MPRQRNNGKASPQMDGHTVATLMVEDSFNLDVEQVETATLACAGIGRVRESRNAPGYEFAGDPTAIVWKTEERAAHIRRMCMQIAIALYGKVDDDDAIRLVQHLAVEGARKHPR